MVVKFIPEIRHSGLSLVQELLGRENLNDIKANTPQNSDLTE